MCKTKNEITLYPGKIKIILFLLFCAGFALIGISMIIDKKPMGWFVALAFAFGTLIFMIMLLPGSSYLQLNEDGFKTCTLYRIGFYYWKDIAFFTSGRIGGNKTVFFNFSPHYKGQDKGRKVALAIAGAEGALPDTYGKKAEDLAKLMNEWKYKYGA